jgi:hypothetical protein
MRTSVTLSVEVENQNGPLFRSSAVFCFPIRAAVSMGRCKTGLEFTCRSFKAQSFSRALIEAQGYLVEVGL